MAELTWYNFVTSAGVVSALISTGAFIQKCRDNSTEIIQLKDRVKKLEEERVEIAALAEKVDNLEKIIFENKKDLKEDLAEIKQLLIRGKTLSAGHGI